MSEERELLEKVLLGDSNGDFFIPITLSKEIEELLLNKQNNSELYFKIANAIADQFVRGFCDDRMVEHFAGAIEKELEPFIITPKVVSLIGAYHETL